MTTNNPENPTGDAQLSGDWRALVRQSHRSSEVRKIAGVLASLEPGTTTESKQMLAVRFEEQIFAIATSLGDYRKNLAEQLKKLKKKKPPHEEDKNVNDNEYNLKIIGDNSPPPFYVAHGTSFYDKILKIRSKRDPMLQFRLHAQSEPFQRFVSSSGIQEAKFECNSNAVDPSNPLLQKFRNALNHPSLKEKFVALVFHGTARKNIPDILQNGLDPTLRKGQAYGPGEYFSKDPSISVSYCKGDKAMLVFAVIIPPPQRESQPAEYIVVNEKLHQLPLGILHFKSVDKEALSRSMKMKTALQSLHAKVYKKEKLMIQAKLKSQIIQYIIQSNIYLAMEKYEKFSKDFPEEFNREISMYIYQYFDRDKSVVDSLFPNLPPPFERSEFDCNIQIKSVETREEEAKSAQDDLNKKQNELMSLY